MTALLYFLLAVILGFVVLLMAMILEARDRQRLVSKGQISILSVLMLVSILTSWRIKSTFPAFIGYLFGFCVMLIYFRRWRQQAEMKKSTEAPNDQ
jgi:Ca2+/Na+ antiporter